MDVEAEIKESPTKDCMYLLEVSILFSNKCLNPRWEEHGWY
jgi:hypothetical protein